MNWLNKNGELVSFSVKNRAKLNSLKINFRYTQDGNGEPSLDNIRPIHGFDEITVKHYGKNLYNNNFDTLDYYPNSNGELVYFSAEAGGTRHWWATSDYIPVRPDDFISYKGATNYGTAPYGVWYDKDKNLVSTFKPSIGGRTILVPDDVYYLRLPVFYWNSTPDSELLQVEVNNEPTDYESVKYNEYHVSWKTNVGTVYGGYIDLVTGELVVTLIEYPVDETIISYSQKVKDGIEQLKLYIPGFANKVQNLYSDMFSISVASGTIGKMSLYSGALSFNIPEDQLTSFDNNGAFEWYEQYHPTFICELKEPEHYKLDGLEIYTYSGDNNIYSDFKNIEIQYADYKCDSTDALIRKRKIMVESSPHIETVSSGNTEYSSDIANFETDIVAPLKSCKVTLEPKQDFNGYGKAWVGGNGKNLFSDAYLKPGYSVTDNGITYVVDNDGSITANGVATANNSIFYIVLNNLQPGDYKVTWGQLPNIYMVGLMIWDNTASRRAMKWNGTNTMDSGRADGDFIEFKYEEGHSYSVCCGRFYGIKDEVTISDVKFYPMICAATETDPTFEPYENICPISGYDKVDVSVCGKNLFNIESLANDNITVVDGVATGTIEDFYQVYGRKHLGYDDGCLPVDVEDKRINLSYTCWTDGNKTTNSTGSQIYFKYTDNTTKVTANVPNTTQSPTRFSASSYLLYSGQPLWYIGFSYYSAYENIWHFKDMQVELGTTETEYEPYSGSIYEITLPSEAGTVYGGTLDVVSGVLIVDTAILTLNTVDMDNDPRWPGWRNSGIRSIIGGGRNDVINAHTNIGAYVAANTSGGQSNPSSYDVIYLPINQNNKTQDEWKELAIDVQFAIKLKNPVRYQLTQQQIQTLCGINNVYSNGTSISIEYWKH